MDWDTIATIIIGLALGVGITKLIDRLRYKRFKVKIQHNTPSVSIGFIPEETIDNDGQRVITKMKLTDMSIVEDE